MDDPLGLLYLAAAARDRHEILLLDAYSFRMEPEKVVSLLAELKPDAVGVSMIFSGTYAASLEILRGIRAVCPEIHTFVGGNTATFLATRLCALPEVDYVMRGESDISFPLFLDALAQNGDLRAVPGLTFLAKDGTQVDTPAPPPADLDALPFPARDLLPFTEKYTRSFLSARGCSYGCIYCSASAFWERKVRFRSDTSLLQEIDSQRDFLFDHFFSINDDCFTLNPHRALRIAHGIRDLDLHCQWGCTGRLERITPALLKELRDCGCIDIFFGVESGSPRILERLGRQYTPDKVMEVYHCCMDLGMAPAFSFIVGLPGEGREELEETYRLLDKLRGVSVGLHLLTPLPGTAIAEHPEQFGITLSGHDPGTLDINRGIHLHTDRLSSQEIQEAYREGVGRIIHAAYLPRGKRDA